MKNLLAIFFGALAAVVVGGLVLMQISDQRKAREKRMAEIAATSLQLAEMTRILASSATTAGEIARVRGNIESSQQANVVYLREKLMTPEAAKTIDEKMQSAEDLLKIRGL